MDEENEFYCKDLEEHIEILFKNVNKKENYIEKRIEFVKNIFGENSKSEFIIKNMVLS